MKPLMRLLLVLVVFAAGWIWWTYPQIGHLTYENAAALESRLYGFEEHRVDLSELSMSLYQGGARDSAEPVLLIHGYSAEKAHWLRFAQHLVEDHYVVIPDLAGHGDTGFDPAWDYRIPAQGARIIALMDALDIERAHLVGSSMGGNISAWLALEHPERVRSATLLDPGGVVSPERSDMERMVQAGRNPFEVGSRAEFDEFYAMTMAQPPVVPGFVKAGLAERAMQRRDELAQIFHDIRVRNVDMADELPRIQVPTLVIWGREDRLLHVSATEIWGRIPGSQVEIWDGIGHLPMMEDPARTAQRFVRFVKGI